MDPARAEEMLAAAREREARARAQLAESRQAAMQATVLLAEGIAKACPRAHRFDIHLFESSVSVEFLTQFGGVKRPWQRSAGLQAEEERMAELLSPWVEDFLTGTGMFPRQSILRKELGSWLADMLMGEEPARAWRASREAFMLSRACEQAVANPPRKTL